MVLVAVTLAASLFAFGLGRDPTLVRSALIGREAPSFDLPRLAAALSARTRAVIINSPNNPTGAIYPEAALAELIGLVEQLDDDGHRRE